MELPTLGSPTRWTAPEVRSQGEQQETQKQFIGRSKLDTSKEKSFRYLDFAEGGTNAALNKWGQFLQLSRLVVGRGDTSNWNYISLEPRNILGLEHIAPVPESHDHKQKGEEEDSGRGRGSLGSEHDNPKWKPGVYCCSGYLAHPGRHDEFNALCIRNQGLGLRFSNNTKISDPEHYYRNDRWPEVRYTVEENITVVLQYYIRDGEIIQDMFLTSESDEETELNLEFDFTTGIRITPGNMSQPKEGNVDVPDHFLQRVSEGEAPGSHWKIRRGDYYATASLFKDGEPKSFSLLVDGEQENKAECRIGILSDEPLSHRETFVLKSKASAKFTFVFKLDHESVPVTLPHYFDISRLELFDGRWWSFRTESSSFIFRRNLETILSHAMPLPPVEGEDYQPYVLHDHDLINTLQTWSSSLSRNQTLYLLEIDKILQHPGTADEETKSHYRERIREVIFGYFVWLLRHAELNGFSETDILHWSGKRLLPTKEYEPAGGKGDPKEEEGKETLKGFARKSQEPEAEETATPAEASASNPDDSYTEEPVDPSNARPSEPELSKYEDKFRNCCQFLILLDMCLINYPDEVSLFTRMVKAFLKLAWEPIEMSRHRGSQLWPDHLESPSGYPPPYARFIDRTNLEGCGYGGQGIYVYVITTQVLVWRAIKSTNKLLKLVSNHQSWSNWMIRQSLDDKKIRDRTIEAFRPPAIDTSPDCFPDRFFSKIKGHVKESFLDQWSCDIAIPSFVEDFFFDKKNGLMLAWAETLRYYDTFSDRAGTQVSNTWEHFMRYQFTIDKDRREALRENFEARANMNYNARASCAQGPMLPQEGVTSAGINPGTTISVGARQDGGKPGKGKGFDISAEDRSQVNDPPFLRSPRDVIFVLIETAYGDWYWFREPLFMKYKAEKFEMNKGCIEMFLEPGDKWRYFWETSGGKDKFLKNMVDTPNYDWGNKNTLVKPRRDGDFGFFQGNEALLKLQEKEQRDPQEDKKRILVMEDCKIQHLITLMASIGFQEAGHIGEFLSRLRLMDPHEMRFAEQCLISLKTIMPDNLWITEFNINFITAPYLAKVESPHPLNYFAKKRAKFQSINDVVSNRITAEAAMGFRVIGDLHDRCWTCYVFYDFGSQELISEAREEVGGSDYGSSSSQRKCLEGFLVRQALDLVLSETKAILQIITKSMGGNEESSQTFFNTLLTEDGHGGGSNFETLNKNSVFYPWLLGIYRILRDKCKASSNAADQWILAEKTRKYKPRWSEKDQKSFGEDVAKNRMEVKARCTELEKMAKNLQDQIDEIKHLKKVTIVAIQDFQKPSPTKALIRITLAVALVTLILLVGIFLFRRGLAALETWAQRLVHRTESGHRESTHNPDEVEKRTIPMTDVTPDIASGWRCIRLMAIFIVIMFPVQELAFIIRTFQPEKIRGAGPLKKLVRVPWAPIWILQLALVYVIILAGYALLFLVGLVHRACVWLWTGDDILGREEVVPEGGEKSSCPGSDSTRGYGRLVGWLEKPVKAMRLSIVAEALRSKEKGKEKTDVENQGTAQ
ncbi:unnamed protein product [Tuber aestivum]|uniref:Uncharacterized protein n=1 Tax=Tuber aestivum TaxID=59557 RepID=A0A292Q5E0_9PEZI|nr:unnamed protein product [Tuber aestivum]